MSKNLKMVMGGALLALIAVASVSCTLIGTKGTSTPPTAEMAEATATPVIAVAATSTPESLPASDEMQDAEVPEVTPEPIVIVVTTTPEVEAEVVVEATEEVVMAEVITTDPDWTTGWNIAYLNKTEWSGRFVCEGPAVCEWWDEKGDDYSHEGFIILVEGESVTFPAPLIGKSFVGTTWYLDSSEEAQRLITTYRQLVFYANQFDNSYWIGIFGQETFGRYLGGLTLQPKPQHIYMAEYNCNFETQTECAELDVRVRHLPEGIEITIN